MLRLPTLEEAHRLTPARGAGAAPPESPGAPAPRSAATVGLAPASRALPAPERRWSLQTLAGRITELTSAGASLAPAACLVRETQERGEPVAWIAAGPSTFFPPDFDELGIDLVGLPVVRVAGPLAGARAAEHLLRSGAFGAVILDLCDAETSAPGRPFLDPAVLTRLAALCRRHHTALLCLTRSRHPERNGGALGSLVSLRAEGTVRRTGFDLFTWELQILKDKVQGPGWSHAEVCRGPDGLC